MTKLLYAHGFASGPQSSKGRALAAHVAARGGHLELLDLRVPSASSPRLSAMIDVVRGAIGGPDDRAIAIGSSLGGLSVARAAEADARIVACVLIAPALGLVPRWRARTGEEAWSRWQRGGTMRYEDHATGGALDVDFGFMEDAMRVDSGLPDVRVPCGVFLGTRDDVIDLVAVRAFASTRKNVRLVEVDDDHAMGASVPAIAEAIDAFASSQ